MTEYKVLIDPKIREAETAMESEKKKPESDTDWINHTKLFIEVLKKIDKFIDGLIITFNVLDRENPQVAVKLYAELKRQLSMLESELSHIPNDSSLQARENELKELNELNELKELNKLKKEGIRVKFNMVHSLLELFPDNVIFAPEGGRKRTGVSGKKRGRTSKKRKSITRRK